MQVDTTEKRRVLTIDNAAKMFPGLSASAIRRLVRSGEISSCRIGKKYLITVEGIEKFLRGETKDGT